MRNPGTIPQEGNYMSKSLYLRFNMCSLMCMRELRCDHKDNCADLYLIDMVGLSLKIKSSSANLVILATEKY